MAFRALKIKMGDFLWHTRRQSIYSSLLTGYDGRGVFFARTPATELMCLPAALLAIDDFSRTIFAAISIFHYVAVTTPSHGHAATAGAFIFTFSYHAKTIILYFSPLFTDIVFSAFCFRSRVDWRLLPRFLFPGYFY